MDGHEEIWLIGDVFLSRSSDVIMKRLAEKSYMHANYQVRVIASSPVTSHVPDAIARLRNSMIKAWKKFNTIPKMIIIIPEDDVLNAVDFNGFGIKQMFENVIEWIVEEHMKIMDYYRKSAPGKATKNKRFWPFYLWIGASIHTNYQNFSRRVKFNQSLEDVAKMHPKLAFLKPLQKWSTEDPTFYSRIDKRLSSLGLAALWTAIDNAVSYFDNKIIPQIIENKTRNQYHYRRGNNESIRSSGREEHRSTRRDAEVRRTLPKPPEKRF